MIISGFKFHVVSFEVILYKWLKIRRTSKNLCSVTKLFCICMIDYVFFFLYLMVGFRPSLVNNTRRIIRFRESENGPTRARPNKYQKPTN